MIDLSNMGNRRTGKTFRAVMTAMLELSKGRNAVYVGRNSAEVERAYRMARNIFDAAGVDCRKRSTSIQLNNNALFFKCSDNMRGLEGIKVVTVVDGDH